MRLKIILYKSYTEFKCYNRKLLVCREGEGLHVTNKYVSDDILNGLLCLSLQKSMEEWVCHNFVAFRLNKIIPTVSI